MFLDVPFHEVEVPLPEGIKFEETRGIDFQRLKGGPISPLCGTASCDDRFDA